mgnify:CR=1 FL=1
MTVRPGSTPARPPALPRVQLSRDHDRQAVANKRRRGEWERIGRGASVAASDRLDQRARALARIEAVHERLVTPHWFSHESAALLWGLPVWRTPGVTHVHQRGRASARRDPSVRRHSARVDATHLTTVAGLPVTDLVQTMVDCARTLRPLPGMVVGDAALRAGADRTMALAMLDELRGERGTARARAVIELADDGAESAGETATRFIVLRAGLPRPQTQVMVETRLGAFWTDLGWEEWRAALEYDGRAKYRTGEDLIAEKRRSDAIGEATWRMLRVTKEDIAAPPLLIARVMPLLPNGVRLVRRPLLLS